MLEFRSMGSQYLRVVGVVVGLFSCLPPQALNPELLGFQVRRTVGELQTCRCPGSARGEPKAECDSTDAAGISGNPIMLGKM